MSTLPRPQHLGLKHLALFVNRLEETAEFYETILNMKRVWQPDPDNIYLSSGTDNLALHRASQPIAHKGVLDHLGFFLKTAADVDVWHEFLKEKHVEIAAPPKQHRDGTRSLYCKDPDGNVVQLIYCP